MLRRGHPAPAPCLAAAAIPAGTRPALAELAAVEPLAHATGSLVRARPDGWVRRDGVGVPFRVLVGE
jgi:hypothetical protein